MANELKIGDIIVPNVESSIKTWANYYYSLKKMVRATNAKKIFIQTFDSEGNDDIKENTDFQTFLTQNKINLDANKMAGSKAGNIVGIMILLTFIVAGGLFIYNYLRLSGVLINFAKQITPSDVIGETKAIGDVKNPLKGVFNKKEK
jgi:hypothetical protein